MQDLVNLPLVGKDAFLVFTKIVRDAVGLALEENKEYLLDSRLSPISKAKGYESYAKLIEYLNVTAIGPLHWEVFEALLTNETMFFRDEHFFIGLRELVIPKLIQKNKLQKTLNIWCTAVSSGQEAYSLAILLKEHFPQLHDWNVQIQASDVCKNMITKAKAGEYNAVEIHRGLAPHLIEKYFHLNKGGQYVADQSLKNIIHFFNINLIGDLYAIRNFDLILIRNVLIYFLADTKSSVLKKIRAKLSDNESFLILGAAESLIGDSSFTHHRHGKFSFFTKNGL